MTLPLRLALEPVDASIVRGTRMQRHNARTREKERCYVLGRQLSGTKVLL